MFQIKTFAALFVFGQQTGTFYYSALGDVCIKKLININYLPQFP